MKKLLKEFKEFAVKGNMIEIAVGVIIGAAFNKVIDILVKEIFLPPLSLLTDGVKWTNKKIILRSGVLEGESIISEEVAIGYGKLIEAGVDFLIIGFTVFLIIKFMSSWKKKAQDVNNKEIQTPKDIELLNKISILIEQQNDLLKSKQK